MTRTAVHNALCFCMAAVASSVAAHSSGLGDHFWGQWRGPNMDGVAPYGDPPIEWSESINIAWRVEIPGRGASTPIVWNDLVILQTAIPAGDDRPSIQELADWQADGTEVYSGEAYIPATQSQQFVVLALSQATGATRWQTVVSEEQPQEGTHPTNTWASASPVTDGEIIVAYFGSAGLYALDMEGRMVWSRSLGKIQTRNGWGGGSSPALFGEHVIVNWDHEGSSFITALDKITGKELWKRSRDEVTSWFTPIVTSREGSPQILTAGAGRIRSYDLQTGDLLWQGPGLTVNSIPTPVVGNNIAYLMSGYKGSRVVAVDLAQADGELDGTSAIAWEYERDAPYVASPLLYQDTLYFTKHLKGILTHLDAKTGENIYGPIRLEALHNIYASPVAAAGRIYIADQDGTVMVLQHGGELEVLAVNRLDDGFDASPAIVGDAIFLRGRRYLYKIAIPPENS